MLVRATEGLLQGRFSIDKVNDERMLMGGATDGRLAPENKNAWIFWGCPDD